MTEPRMTGSKTCSKCLQDLHVLCFSVDKNHKDGLRSECRDCTREQRASKHLPNRADGRSLNFIPFHKLNVDKL